MNEIITTGKTVEEATEKACAQLGKTRDEVSVEILEMPVKKLFKNIPAKVKVTVPGAESPVFAAPAEKPAPAPPPAQKPQPRAEEPKAKPAAKPQPAPLGELAEPEPAVEIDLSQNAAAARAADYLTGIFGAMGSKDVVVTAYKQGDATLVRVEGEDIGNLLETSGETIQALSYLTDRSANKGVDKSDAEYLRIRLDIAGYRGRREGELVELAQRTGQEVQRTKRSKTLAPMNPYERLIVHTTISGMEKLTSESIGADTERRVVIKSTEPDATEGGDWRPPRQGGGRGGDRGRGGQNRGGPGGQNRSGGGNRQGGGRGGDRDRGRQGGGSNSKYGGPPRSSTPEREYANRPRSESAEPQVPKRKEAIKDGENLPLYGKIEL